MEMLIVLKSVCRQQAGAWDRGDEEQGPLAALKAAWQGLAASCICVNLQTMSVVVLVPSTPQLHSACAGGRHTESLIHKQHCARCCL